MTIYKFATQDFKRLQKGIWISKTQHFEYRVQQEALFHIKNPCSLETQTLSIMKEHLKTLKVTYKNI